MSLDRVLSMDIEWVLYHLIHNDPEFQHLSLDVDFYNDDVWSRLLASLARNSNIESVKLERYQGGDEERTFEDLSNLFTTLATIPSIHTLTISALSSDDFTAALDLLRHESVQMCHLDWTGAEDRSLPLLVGSALSQAPKLTELVLEDPQDIDCELWLSSILQSVSLRRLKIETYSGTRLDPRAGPIFVALQHNLILCEFSLGYLLDETMSQFVTETIRWNRALKVMRLSIVSTEEECYIEILDALQQNQSLVTFENYTATAVGVSSEVEQKQQEMLEMNRQLEFFVLFRDSPDFLKKKAMYLKLNASGRSRLFEEDSNQLSRPQDWLNVMAGTRDSLDCLYYCLSMNPSLCKLISLDERLSAGKRKRSISPTIDPQIVIIPDALSTRLNI